MQFSLQIILAVAAGIAQTQARPAPGEMEKRDEPIDVMAPDYKHCGADTITCNADDSWFPSTTPIDTCQKVIDSLMENEIRTQPRDHCYTETSGEHYGSRCCITWSAEVPRDTPYSKLRPVAQKILDDCKGRKSSDGKHTGGAMHYVEIGEKCMMVCLGPDKKGCNYANYNLGFAPTWTVGG